MEQKTLKCWTLFTLTMGTLLRMPSLALEVFTGESPSVVEKQNVVLSAWYTNASRKGPIIMWTKNSPDSPALVIAFSGNVIMKGVPEFRDRVDFIYKMPNANISIYINETKESDSGQYMYSVLIPEGAPDGNQVIGVLNLTVLVPPSIPVCKMEGSAFVGSNVTLRCSSATGKPKPEYRWRSTSRKSQVFFTPVEDRARGTLVLTNLTKEMSGTYTCTAKNSGGENQCHITFEVIASTNAAVIAGAVVGSVLGACLIIIVIVLFCKYQRKKKETEEYMANDIKEDAQAPKTHSWAKSTSMDVLSKNGTLSSVNTNRDLKPYQSKSPSDTASVLTVSGSIMGYKVPYSNQRTEDLVSSNQYMLVYPKQPKNGNYNSNTTNGDAVPRTNGAQPQVPRHQSQVASGVTSSNLTRMGGIPVMVPAQSQAGSLV
ncbi:endothelial cell adhesion molecule a [Latimeria chalumnae]|uniref:Endothelial cell adhesion molecule n=1 Tax=Latimeria chalumnae TaxID=7897 RepID=H3AG10_LATCH|nr:PREDICTED: endothelial cell-selective adhesion molecule [Latimeria chalumnae]|eukprot:XP_005991196.1 PREDICTED: endothelial cell-selective adhesion molecule [Latimeria chalumnae]